MLICPGFTGTRAGGPYGPYIERFVGAGYAVLHSDYRGWGESEGEPGYLHPLWQVEDLQAGLTYLTSRDEVDPDGLCLFGTSFGGGHAAYLAALDPRVRASVAVSAVADGGRWLREMRREYEWQDLLDRLAAERARVATGGTPTLVDPTEEIQVATPERRARFAGARPASSAPIRTPLECAQAIIEYSPLRLAPAARSILFIHVARDSVVPPEHSRALFAAAGEPKRIVELPGREHYAAYERHFETIWAETAAWLSAHAR